MKIPFVEEDEPKLKRYLHLCTFKTPTSSAVMSEQGDADLWLRTKSATGAFIMRNGVKSSPYLLFETVWSAQGGGQGYYGLCLKSDVRHHRISSTGCRIEKCDMENRVLSSYLTIAKAAEEETMCAAKMSRAIKDKRIFSGSGGDYYFRK